MAKLMAPNIRIDWIPEGGFADPEKPKIHELNSGTNLSHAVVTGYTLNFLDSDAEDVTTIFDDYDNQIFVKRNYEANLQFFMSPRSVGTRDHKETAYLAAEAIFANSTSAKGYLVLRSGHNCDVPYDLGQQVSVFYVESDLTRIISEEGAPILREVSFIPKGFAYPDYRVSQETSYAWAGTPHNSESIKYVDGVEYTRNLVTNPTFGADAPNAGTVEGWARYMGTSMSAVSQYNGTMWYGRGGRYRLEAETKEGDGNVRVSMYLDINKVRGKWLGVRALVANLNDVLNVQLQVELQVGGANSQTTLHNSTSARVYSGAELQGALFVPNNADVCRIFIRFYSDVTTKGWLDEVIACVGDSREEALHYVSDYFDGDTPGIVNTYKIEHVWEGVPNASVSSKYVDGELVNQNLVSNPKPLSTSGWHPSSTTVLTHIIEEGQPTLKVAGISVKVGNLYCWRNVTPPKKDIWVAISAEVKALDESIASDFRYVVTGNSGNTTPQTIHSQAISTEEFTKVSFAVFNESDQQGLIRFNFWPFNRPNDDRVGFLIRNVISTYGDTREEAIAASLEYFDGDTPNE